VLDQVAHLVHDDVVQYVVRREHEAPVEAERALARARSPTAHLVAERDAPVGDSERHRLGLHDQRDARVRLAAPLHGGQAQPLEPEARLCDVRELLLEPGQVLGDRGVDLGVRRARPHDELGRQAVPDDDAVAPDAR
jgi:hypothetical protein